MAPPGYERVLRPAGRAFKPCHARHAAVDRAPRLGRLGPGNPRPVARGTALARADHVRALRFLHGGVVALVCASLALGAFPYPAHERLETGSVRSTLVIDRHGRRLWERRSADGGYGRWVGVDEIAPAFLLATLSSEDAAFFDHAGVDPAGIARAAWLDARAGRFAYGGSTITQQLVKLVEPRPRTLLGKLAEALAALRLERAVTKREILEQYVNRAYYGRSAYGVEAAAQRFFGKPARDLGLDEAALLSTLPRAPTAYDPARHPERVSRRRAHVLSKMAARGWITRSAADEAASAPLRLIVPVGERRAPHVVDHLLVAGLLPPGEPVVHTTIDLALQERLERRVRMHLEDVADRAVDQAGVVVVDVATGEILAMVGSRRYGEESVDGAVNATTAGRHPGSALKPFVYALALEAGANPSSPVLDVPTVYPGYRPRAASRHHRGRVTLREALGSSLNVPAVRLANEHGVASLARLLADVGVPIEDPRHVGLPLALGGAPVRLVDLAEAYATLARGGVHRELTLTAGAPRADRRVLEPATAYALSRMLSDPAARRLEFGLETPLDLPFEVAVKTGTSQSFCDNVAVGYTPEVTVAVWVGNFDGRPMRGVLAMDGAAPLFRDAMLAAMEGRPDRGFRRPAGVEEVEVCADSGQRRGPSCPHARREEVATRHPLGPCEWHDAIGLALPGEEVAHLTGGRVRDEPDQAAVTVLEPVDGERLWIDPLVPRVRQAVPLRVAVRRADVTTVRWEVDGARLVEVGSPFAASLPLSIGEHRVRAVASGPGGETADEVRVTVTRGTR